MAQPLAGVRIADFSHVIAGPLATQFLCLLGADVIKVEPPQGDAMRYYTPRPELRGMAEPFVGANAGKRSVVLDLKTDEGREAARKIALRSDIVVENFRPGVAARLGLGAEALRAEKPGLIYASISGFGQDGPMRDWPAIDQVIQSVSGLMSLSGEDGDAPMRIGFPLVDTYCALMSAFAILAAWTQRQADPQGRGQVVDVSMLDTTLVMMSSVLAPLTISGRGHRRTGNRGFSGAPTADTFATADGDITIGAVQQVQVERLVRTLGCEGVLDDPRFATPDARVAHDAELQAILAERFRARTAEEWEVALAEAGVPAGKVRGIEEALDLPQIAGRGLFLDVPTPHESLPQARILNAGFRFAHDGPGHHRPAPALGEHTEAVLREIADD
ncbi:CaiB/BaiF CoA transferase family protein [Wenxinia marina]|uniref:Putative acyl-CoA transferase/carnitine dehydratase n=1 Tax=Wenxinia marina DSM 24838 TaxID=1123501 RepID=A0A0D0NNJ7_9RHOB|nr:CoA transferase [Wenxinia marina]KIQ69825.1 putative acyl-CoA transferase/carnitine dehydratase [Wenxinia marina DSM 24838]GGL61548.1 CoA transferase [Wenxinia marina]